MLELVLVNAGLSVLLCQREIRGGRSMGCFTTGAGLWVRNVNLFGTDKVTLISTFVEKASVV